LHKRGDTIKNGNKVKLEKINEKVSMQTKLENMLDFNRPTRAFVTFMSLRSAKLAKKFIEEDFKKNKV